MGNVNCPKCRFATIVKPIIKHSFGTVYECYSCHITFYAKEPKNMKYVVIRDDNNKQFDTVEQASIVAEKLTKESAGGHNYYVAKLIKEFKLSSVVVIDLE